MGHEDEKAIGELERKVRDCQIRIWKNQDLSEFDRRRLWRDLDNLLGLYFNSQETGEPIFMGSGVTFYSGFSEGFALEVKKKIEEKLSELGC